MTVISYGIVSKVVVSDVGMFFLGYLLAGFGFGVCCRFANFLKMGFLFLFAVLDFFSIFWWACWGIGEYLRCRS